NHPALACFPTRRSSDRIRNEAGDAREADLWTSCFTPRELRLLCERAGTIVDGIFAVRPGEYGAVPPDLDHPEWLVICTRHRSARSEEHTSELQSLRHLV